ncbi:putative aspartic-type endopeptidase [Lachnellula subtilissima]|uniref:Putative aspartic-type endopeptidase n=1 Tax=Lachnellula subtilissima TaxID=602034 RepID=A0A8H8U8G3_9HELO|nr:putative aspartic-type endopeptidase [Lachnellula subtilissima]
MKYLRCSAALAGATLVSYVAATVTMNMTRGPNLHRRNLAARDSITAVLNNNITGGSYYVEVNVGSPGQKQTMALDTGSSDVWLLSSTADLCTSAFLQAFLEDGCASTFDHNTSSTYKLDKQGRFSIRYVDQSGASGDYISDVFQIGGKTLETLEMGLAYESTVGTGLIGIGYSLNEASDARNSPSPFVYPSIIDTMLRQGLIDRRAYSLYLNDLNASTGSIIFGGLDADKYQGSLLHMPVVPTRLSNGSSLYLDLGVALTSFGITGQHGNTVNLTATGFKEVAILDSGTTITLLPTSIVANMYKKIGAVDDTNGTGVVFIDCAILKQSPDLTFNYGFGNDSGHSIVIPINEVVFDLKDYLSDPDTKLPPLPFKDPCAFGIYDGGSTGPYLLGDTFLRSAYVVYDLDDNVIAIAQTHFNSSSSNLVEFRANETGIPRVSGMASSVRLPGTGGGKTTTRAEGAETASAAGLVTTDSDRVLTGSTVVVTKATAKAVTTVTATRAGISTASQSKEATAGSVSTLMRREY